MMTALFETLKTLYDIARETLKTLYDMARVVLIILALATATAFILAVPDQSHELYRVLAQDLALTDRTGLNRVLDFKELFWSVIGLIMMSFCFWYVSARLIKKTDLASRGYIPNFVKTYIPVLLGVLPLIGAVYGLARAQISATNVANSRETIMSWTQQFYGFSQARWNIIKDILASQYDNYVGYLSLFYYLMIAIAVAFVAICVTLTRSQALQKNIKSKEFMSREFVYFLAIALVVMIVLTYSYFINISQFFGVVFIFSVFMCILTFFTGQIVFFSIKNNFPFLGLLVFCAVAFAVLGINDNHRVHILASDESQAVEAPTGPPKLRDEFMAWYNSRIDLPEYKAKDRPYPIFIVAAEGGGMYAAYHTASFLGAQEDQCPSFAHHLFAVSAVSGGSVGASVFSAIASQVAEARLKAAAATPCIETLHAKPGGIDERSERFFDLQADEIFNHDFLAPLISGLLFPDFLQRFLPIPVDSFDRARTIEAALSQSWEDSLTDLRKNRGFWKDKKNILTDNYLSHWRASGSGPALLLNTTEVRTGKPRVISPFVFSENKLSFLPLWNEGWAKNAKILPLSISLSTVAMLSARFPWLTPAGWFHDVSFAPGTREPITKGGKPRYRRVQLVDGGYFDNSGVLTALELIRSLNDLTIEAGLQKKVQINLIVLASADDMSNPSSNETELMAPITSLLNSRIRTGRAIVDEAFYELAASKDGLRNVRVVELKDVGYPLALGWRLSQMTRILMRTQSGDRQLCLKDGGGKTSGGAVSAACTAEWIYRQLEAIRE